MSRHDPDPDQQAELRELLRHFSQVQLPRQTLDEAAPRVPGLSQAQFQELLRERLCRNDDPDATGPLILDVRSEREFAADGLPGACNIPLLDNHERHIVGLLYKQASPEQGVAVALHFWAAKAQAWISQVRERACGRELIVYCWRGGGRSRFATGQLLHAGCQARQLIGGQKHFRRMLHKLLYKEQVPLLSLDGLTGCGKTQLLESLRAADPQLPILDFEGCAAHASSVYGQTRFHDQTPPSQHQFEQRLFLNLLRHRRPDGSWPIFLCERESRAIGRLQIPPGLWSSLRQAPVIMVEASLAGRVARIGREYFGSGEPERVAAIRAQTERLVKHIGGDKVRAYQALIDAGNYDEFSADILVHWYDRCYATSGEEPLCCVNSDQPAVAAAVIKAVWHGLS